MGKNDVKTDRILQMRSAKRAARRYILCVDDERAVLTQLIHQLTRRFGASHRVEGAESAEEAVRLVEELARDGSRVELVICDQIMPGMGGDHFLELMHKQYPEMIKILLTGHAGIDSATYAINHAGLHKYIEKPWAVEDLNLTVQNLLTQYALHLENKEYHRQLERKNACLRSLHDLALHLATLPTVDETLPAVLECARKLASGSRVGLFVCGNSLRTAGDTWSFTSNFGIEEESRAAIRALVAPAPHEGDAAQMSFSIDVKVQRAEGHPAFDGKVVVFPIRTGERCYGAVLCAPRDDGQMAGSDSEFITILANQSAIALENRLLLDLRMRSEKLAAIGHMVSAVTHDYRTPMTVIKGYAEMLETDDLSSEDRKKFGTLIGGEVDRMERMINELHDFVRGSRGPLKASACSIQELIEEIHTWIGHDLRTAGVAVNMSFPEPGVVMADPDKLKRAFTNILKNALEAMPQGGDLRVTLASDGEYYRVTFADTGVGIPEQNLGRVFEPFFTSGKRRGLGLGTSITRSIIEEHGGNVSIDSRPGSGTTFTVSLPRPIPVAAQQ